MKIGNVRQENLRPEGPRRQIRLLQIVTVNEILHEASTSAERTVLSISEQGTAWYVIYQLDVRDHGVLKDASTCSGLLLLSILTLSWGSHTKKRKV
mmetsp:Transcript_8352/g.17020  ORF Transcript_8352/g.17020 Transcript_8352/m.17020 type:complete len:96 (-) Transcript_8352:292-579(-)